MLFAVLSALAVGAPIKRLETISCENGATVEIEVRRATVAVPGIVEFETRAYHFGGTAHVPGKTIAMRAGERCNIKVVNNLEGTACTGGHENSFHCPDTTGLHTHGLHVSPEEDNIDTHIEPNGDSWTYQYNMPEDHLMGTHWYHAHHHGSTALQVMGGMVGILTVEPAAGYTLPADLKALYDDDTVPLMVMTHMCMGGGDPDTPVYGALDQAALVDAQPDVRIPLNANWLDDSQSGRDFYVVNGEYNPTVTIKADTATLLRIVHGGGNRHVTLWIDDPSQHCTLTLVARDGVFQYTPYLTLTAITMIQGTRVDVAITCAAAAAGMTFNVEMSRKAPLMVSTQNLHVQKNVLSIAVEAGSSPRAAPTSQATFPSYLNDLLGDSNAKVGGERGVSEISFTVTGNDVAINRNPFAGWDEPDDRVKYQEEFCLYQTYELKIESKSYPVITPGGPALSNRAIHPYHQHINHMQIVNGQDPSGQIIREGEWRDVVPAWGDDYPTIVRFHPYRFTGDVVVHCHILQHEDLGMMGLYKMVDCGNAGPSPAPEDTAVPGTTDAPTSAPTDAPQTPTTDVPAGMPTAGRKLVSPVRVAAFNTVDDEQKFPSGPQIDYILSHTQPSYEFDLVGVIENMNRESVWDSVAGFTTYTFESSRPSEQLLYRTTKFDSPTNGIKFQEAGWGAYYVSHVDLEEIGGGCVRVFVAHFPIEKTAIDGPDDLTSYAMGRYVVEQLHNECSNILTGDLNTILLSTREKNLKRLDDLLASSLESFLEPTTVSNVLYVMCSNDMGFEGSEEYRDSALSDHPIAVTICTPPATTDVPLATAMPTDVPTGVPTAMPTVVPTEVPLAETAVPTTVPTTIPTGVPTVVPTTSPSSAPTMVPTAEPTQVPTAAPTTTPAGETAAPTAVPTSVPTSEPTTVPTQAPPTDAPPTAQPGIPETDAPVTDVPDTDAPDTTAPMTDAPDTIVPTTAPTDAPATDAPPTSAPPTAHPGIPETAAPVTIAPDTDTPMTDVPMTNAPDTSVPTTAPTGAPATDSPPTSAPPTAHPGIPETAAPATIAPDTDAPATLAPETDAPDTSVPTTAPTDAPATVAPPTSAPPTAYPGIPATDAPATGVPDTATPTSIPTAGPTTVPAGMTATPTTMPTAPTDAPATVAPPTAYPGIPATDAPDTNAPTDAPTSSNTSVPGSTPPSVSPLPEGTSAPVTDAAPGDVNGIGEQSDEDESSTAFPWWIILVVVGGLGMCALLAFAVLKQRHRDDVSLEDFLNQSANAEGNHTEMRHGNWGHI